MVSLFRCHGLVLSYGELAKPEGVSAIWNTAALFDVPDPNQFDISVVVLSEGRGDCKPAYIVGVIPASTKLSTPHIEEKAGAFALFDDYPSFAEDPPKIGNVVVDAEWPAENLQTHPTAQFQLSYSDGCIFVACNGGPRVKVLKDIPPGNYRPCISIGNPGVRLRIVMRTPRKRSRLVDGEGGLLKMAKSLWEDKKFADATVACGEKVVPVHRCVLTTASAFFAKAFDGGMREAQEKRIVINDVGADILDVFLNYIYTRDVPDTVELDKLLPLAHRYEVSDLVETCMMKMTDDLCESNVCRYVAAIRPFQSDPSISSEWEKIIERISKDPVLMRAVICG